jgi:hypothetical protein
VIGLNKKGFKMWEKVKAVLDSKSTWLTVGAVAGSVFGQKALEIVSGFGQLVMAII